MGSFVVVHEGKLLSTEFSTIKKNSKWQCQFGHVFEKPYADMKYRIVMLRSVCDTSGQHSCFAEQKNKLSLAGP
jgi:hypothetical protein